MKTAKQWTPEKWLVGYDGDHKFTLDDMYEAVWANKPYINFLHKELQGLRDEKKSYDSPFSEQIKAKDKWIERLLKANEALNIENNVMKAKIKNL